MPGIPAPPPFPLHHHYGLMLPGWLGVTFAVLFILLVGYLVWSARPGKTE